MRRGIGRLRAGGSVVDTDAAAWAAAVVSAGGTYSGTTLAAVSAFCVSAKAKGYWTKLNRINLMCGDQLTAARVPLKVGLGSSTDANVSFVAGNYTESTGLTGNGTTKYLQTGLTASGLTTNDTHFAVYNRSSTGGGACGATDASSNAMQFLPPFTDGNVYSDQYNNTGGAGRVVTGAAIGTPYGFLIGTRTASNVHTIYRNGSSAATNATTGGSLPAIAIHVFAANSNGTPGAFMACALAGYSIGSGLSSTDASNYYTDLQAFQTALGRNV